MTEVGNASVSSAATDTLTVHTKTTTDAAKGTNDAAGKAIRLIRGLLLINLGLVALQPLSAGFFLSGYARAATFHAIGGQALLLGALIQAVTAVVLWRRRRVPASMAGFSIGLFMILFLEVGLGYTKRFWLHVPIGVGIFGGLMRQVSRLDVLRGR